VAPPAHTIRNALQLIVSAEHLIRRALEVLDRHRDDVLAEEAINEAILDLAAALVKLRDALRR
jgi:hypothetical protein